MAEEKKTSSIKSLQKAIELLKVLSSNAGELSIGELADQLHLPKATVHRILVTLQRGGLVEKSAIDGKYRLGVGILEMASKLVSKLDIRNQSRSLLEELMRETGECVYLAVLSGDEIIYIDKVENNRAFTINTEIGCRAPAHATALGKVLLANLPEHELEGYLTRASFSRLPRFTANTITSVDELRIELKKIKEKGYAYDDQELEEGLRCLAVPVRNHLGNTVAAISIAGLASRFTEATIPWFLEKLISTGVAVSERLGYVGTVGENVKYKGTK